MPSPAATLLVFGRGVVAAGGGWALTADSLARVGAAAEHVARAGAPARIVFTGGWAGVSEGAPEPPAGRREGDDGSGPAAAAVLDAARALGATVLHHPANRGKGAALKTGLAHIAGRGRAAAWCAPTPLGESARVYRPLLAGLFGADARER
ncbi:hypothetical protein [Dactylosporangium sp. NPDC049140]|uniref:hypothetical protein n=1 Tax=Dactylosporangium sp. NPDC049140 TaxID=3155647 RepID=UPI0033E06ED1